MAKDLLLFDGKRLLLKLELRLPTGEGSPDEELDELVSLFAVAANRRRLQIMLELGRLESAKFTDLLRVGINPKLVRDCLTPMIDLGLVEHEEGKDYRLSEKGNLVVPALALLFPRLLKRGPGGK